MKTIELSTGTLLVVDDIPNGVSVGLYEYKTGYWLRDPLKDRPYPYHKELPPGQWQLLGHPSEITGEVWGKVVEMYPACSDCYKDYGGYVFGDDVCVSATESGLSLIAAHGIKETDVLLFKSKT